ncbi:MAG: phospholipid carrier-dependent glycosyltransferase [Myxococcales bacterium]|nr:phospholipid carrier-dependent glycosyltransferase [Myxococcales bacterium]
MRIGRLRPWIWPLLVLLCAASFIVNLAVIIADQIDDAYDPMHLEKTGRLLAHALQGNAAAWEAFRLDTAASSYPSLIHYTTLPVRWIAGDVPRAGAVTVAVWSLLAILSAFGIGHLLAGDRAGMFAALFTALTPGLYRFSRMEMVDVPLAAVVTLAIFLLLRSDGLLHRAPSLAFGAVCSVGMMTKQSFPLYLAVPSLYLILAGYLEDKSEARRHRLLNVLIAGAMTLLAGVAVLVPNLHAWFTGRQVVRAFYLQTDEAGFLDNLRLLITDGLGPILSVLTLIGLLVVSKKDRGVRTLILWLAAPLLVLHITYGMLSTRYLLPLLPAGTVLAALGLEQLPAVGSRSRRIAKATVLILLVVAATAYDHLRPEQTVFSFESYENRLHLVGVPRPQRSNWGLAPLTQALETNSADARVILLIDSPFTSMIQGRLWMLDPLANVTNLFEWASVGRTPPGLDNDDTLREYLSAADFLVVKTGFNRDVRNYSQPQDVDAHFAQRVFQIFFEIKPHFELIQHFPYPEDIGPILLYQRRQGEPAEATTAPPNEVRREIRSAPDLEE